VDNAATTKKLSPLRLFCVVMYGTLTRPGLLGPSEALKGFVSRHSEIAAPLTNSTRYAHLSPDQRLTRMHHKW
jgi:hypothetical protein